jgi:hypothetical protein
LIVFKDCSVTRKGGLAHDEFEACSVTRSDGCGEPEGGRKGGREGAQARKVGCSNPGSNHGTWAIFIHGGVVRDLRNEPVWHSANIAGIGGVMNYFLFKKLDDFFPDFTCLPFIPDECTNVL